MFNTHIFRIQQLLVKGRIVQLNNFHQPTYRITFDNGYENIFFQDVETGKWLEEDLGFTELAEQVGKVVLPFEFKPIHVPRKLHWHKKAESPSSRFGFYHFRDGNKKMFEIYHFNKKYLFSLEQLEDEDWLVFKINEKNLNGNLAAMFNNVMRTLPMYVGNLQ